MTITAWRLFKKRHRATAFSGEGAKLYGGRWNAAGVAVVYASESRSLALLETLVHLEQRPALKHFLISEIQVDAGLVERIADADLPRGWNSDPPTAASQTIGNRWVAEARTAVLMVPSVLVPNEYNLLLNPAHADFAKVSIAKPEPFSIDTRFGP